MACGESQSHKIRGAFLYNLGRLFSYALLGCIASLFGMAFNKAASLSGVSNLFLYLYTGFLIIFGLYGVMTFILRGNSPSSVERKNGIASGLLWKKAFENIYSIKNMKTLPFMLGAVSGLLPCGFLWIFVGFAAVQADLFSSLIVMVIFWIGTVPAMTLIGFCLTRLRNSSAARFLPLVVSLLISLSGFSLIYKHQLLNINKNLNAEHSLSCH